MGLRTSQATAASVSHVYSLVRTLRSEKASDPCCQAAASFRFRILAAVAPCVWRDIPEHLLDVPSAAPIAWFSARRGCIPMIRNEHVEKKLVEGARRIGHALGSDAFDARRFKDVRSISPASASWPTTRRRKSSSEAGRSLCRLGCGVAGTRAIPTVVETRRRHRRALPPNRAT